jgi:regulator of chromosome condensation (RCC1) repeat-containing protein
VVIPRFASLSVGTLVLAASACGSPLRGPLEPTAAVPEAPPANDAPVADARVTGGLAAGGGHTCALEMKGLYCWGDNANGELGVAPGSVTNGPVAVSGLGANVVELEANSLQTCVRLAGGRVECWGRNVEGQLGDGTTTDRARPAPVARVEDAVEIAAGGLSTCVRRAGGTVVCWGAFGLGQGSLTPVEVAGLTDVVELRTGQPGGRYCARTRAGQVFCWDFNDTESTTPDRVPALDGTHDLAVTIDQICALTNANQVLCLDLALETVSVVEGVDDAVQLVAGVTFVCWRRTGGDVGCSDHDGVVLPARRDFALDVPAVDLAAGQVHFCVRVSDGGVECFHDPKLSTTEDALVRVADLPL